MNGNICPKCGKPVMPYERFLQKAEPFKRSICESCGTKLRRGWTSYVVMCGIIVIVTVQLFLGMNEARLSPWIVWPTIILWLICLTLIINFWLWRYVGWKEADKENKQ